VQPTNNDLQYQRMQQALATAEGRLQAQNQQMTELQRQIEEIRNPPAPPARLYDDTDVEAFGAENVDLVQRIVRQEFGSRLDAIDRTLNEMRGTMQRLAASTQQVQAQTQLSAAEKFDAKLVELVPDWEVLNVDPRFLDWLEKVDIVSNQKYGELLVDAYRQGQAERTAHFFNLYKKDAGIAPATPAPTPPPAPPTGVDPTAFIAPAAGAPTPPPTQPGQPRIWTMAEGDKIYEDFRRGLIKKPEFERLEREYVQAAKEGRVRP
jgi:hypothetical protein